METNYDIVISYFDLILFEWDIFSVLYNIYYVMFLCPERVFKLVY